MNLMEQHDQELTSVGAMVAQDPIEADSDLKKMEKIRLAKWLLKIGLAGGWSPPGSFARSHISVLDRQIQRADNDAKGRKTRHQRVVQREDDNE
jgi:hypothetical protein